MLTIYRQRSNTIRAIVEYHNKSFNFGVGQSSVGAGAIGEQPNIVIGNNKLKFQFGKNCIFITELINNKQLELIENKKESNFQLII